MDGGTNGAAKIMGTLHFRIAKKNWGCIKLVLDPSVSELAVVPEKKSCLTHHKL